MIPPGSRRFPGRTDALGDGRFVRRLSGKAAGRRDLRLLRHYGGSGMPTTAEMTTIEAVDIANAREALAARPVPAGLPRGWSRRWRR